MKEKGKLIGRNFVSWQKMLFRWSFATYCCFLQKKKLCGLGSFCFNKKKSALWIRIILLSFLQLFFSTGTEAKPTNICRARITKKQLFLLPFFSTQKQKEFVLLINLFFFSKSLLKRQESTKTCKKEFKKVKLWCCSLGRETVEGGPTAS